LGQVHKIDSSTKPLTELAESLLFNIEDIIRRLRDYTNSIEVNPVELERLEGRMAILNEMKRKYGNTLQEVVRHRDKIKLQLEELDTSESKIQSLLKIEIEQKQLLSIIASTLSIKRKELSKLLETKVESYLKGVGMENAQFKVLIDNRKDEEGLSVSVDGNIDSYSYGPEGIDEVKMLFSANKNHSPLPLPQVASGGELSRIMLAIFVTVNSSDTKSTLVFDEIDSGVGGRTGTIIGQRLRDLSKQRQVICVTHLPQLASFANNHWSIIKKESNDRVVVSARLLEGDEVVKELGLMIASGDKTSDIAARAMINQAKTQI
jgi:DNA repair protein RecN (Recombination protein N)